MPLVISDDDLQAANLTPDEARVEIACRLFDAGRLTVGHAAHMAGLTEPAFEEQLHLRGIPRYRYTQDMLEADVQTLKKLGRW
jgi:predicted HTH domain antitoxin